MDVVAIAAGVTGLRAGARPHADAVAGAKAGALPGAPGAVVATAAVFLAAAVAAGAVFLAELLATTWRAIGRGFGSGTFGLVAASAAHADNPTASARLVAMAVDRSAAARADGVTALLRGESFNR